MTAAVFVFAPNDHLQPGLSTWLRGLLSAMIQENPENRFLVFTNVAGELNLSHPQIEFPNWHRPRFFTRFLSLRQWRKISLRSGADVVLSIGSASFIASTLPQLLVLPPQGLGNARKRITQVAKQKVSGYWVASNKDKELLTQLGVGQVNVVYGGPLMQQSSLSLDPEVIKERYTEGFEYFLYAGPLAPTETFIGLLKAFSRFKKRQKSSWRLVLLPSVGQDKDAEALQQALSNYKYRSDVLVPAGIHDPEQVRHIFSAAYAFVQPQAVGAYGQYIKEALSAGLPLIATSDAINKEFGGNAALYYEKGDEQSLSDCLMMVYKDESLRGRLAAEAQSESLRFTWEQSARAAWAALENSVK